MSFEIGIYHFGELTPDPHSGAPAPSAQQRLKDLIEQAEVADQAGLDIFGLGEHHRDDFAVSASAVVLSAIAMRTSRIRLSSAVTVLSSEDPVRVYEQYATLDNLSDGRAEMIVGRGSYVESFPLFGYDLSLYNDLFEERLQLLDRIQKENPVTWQGMLRPPLEEADISPRALQEYIPTWVAVGGTPASAVRAAKFGLPMALGILGGRLDGFKGMADLYRKSAADHGVDPAKLKISVNGPGFVAETTQEAQEFSYPYYARAMKENQHMQGRGQVLQYEAYQEHASDDGALFVGSPQQIVEKILRQHEAYGHDRYIMQLGYGNTPQRETLRAIELLATEVLPAVRQELG
ncbi:Alkanal monooxygenase alpha chain [Corynebacterium occultum]|uniref:Alkanal monooxygenase alpha chain n=1 Tax=Corynebacterium occultum TaxID=2675219 RepID=A0A6B8WPH2_9CORY|nr:LLM class flavin-dependent oxidoreductase [Corynebacterium occultum]QGU08248.1 Alkanal monooxygenase alpha chain [Corynebacterium occultum]